MKEALLIIDEEGGGFLGVEGRESRPFAPLLAQFDALAHDLGYGQPGPDLVEKGGWEFHHSRDWRSPPRWQGSCDVIPAFHKSFRCGHQSGGAPISFRAAAALIG